MRRAPRVEPEPGEHPYHAARRQRPGENSVSFQMRIAALERGREVMLEAVRANPGTPVSQVLNRLGFAGTTGVRMLHRLGFTGCRELQAVASEGGRK